MFHYLPGSPVLSFGTAGCNLGCSFCQNWDISKAKELDALQENASPEQIAQRAKDLNCSAVAFTYNDPVIFAEYAIDIAHACHEKGIKTIAVTAGYINPEPREAFFAVMDAVNVDLKAFRQTFYKKLCKSDLQPVLDTLLYIKQQNKTWLEITNLLIPEENDTVEEVREMLVWIMSHLGPDIPIHFTAFHPDFRLTHRPNTPADTLKNARKLAQSIGLNYVYTGNIVDEEGGTTYCPSCQSALIVRDWHEIKRYDLKDNACPHCKTKIAGHFPEQAGQWGRKRVPISFRQGD